MRPFFYRFDAFDRCACDSPRPAFIGQPVREVTIDGSRFRVFMPIGSGPIEAHRISAEMLPSLVLALEKAYRAIETATGCTVVAGSLQGDQAIILADVDCAPA